MTDKKRKIGIMGGNFNPPHLAHLMAAECAARELELEKVIFLPTGKISYKDSRENATAEDRLEMTRLAISQNPMFDISDIESVSDEYSYTCFTLEKLKELYKDAELYFIVGADSLDYMDRWKHPQRIFELSSVAVVDRQGFGIGRCLKKAEELKSEFGADIHFVEMPRVDISSSVIRERIASGQPVEDMLTDAVFDYIRENNLYL
ncbi:MAG: nicotinate-nucleotide adenylyltransferase [Clostridia bacterium]|nr:nicotinate-nucleotide adenylyltransferase [Clostridia bacterium]